MRRSVSHLCEGSAKAQLTSTFSARNEVHQLWQIEWYEPSFNTLNISLIVAMPQQRQKYNIACGSARNFREGKKIKRMHVSGFPCPPPGPKIE